MANTKKSLVSEARDALTKFKLECAAEIGRTQYCKENNTGDKSNVSAKQNGSEGGPIGGQMTKRMIEQAKKGM